MPVALVIATACDCTNLTFRPWRNTSANFVQNERIQPKGVRCKVGWERDGDAEPRDGVIRAGLGISRRAR